MVLNKDFEKRLKASLKCGFGACVGEAYEFVNREGVLVRPTKDGLNPVGKAYCFFDCKAPREAILNKISGIPKEKLDGLELRLADKLDIYDWDDNDLKEAEKDARKSGLKYVLEATRLNTPNSKVAEELSTHVYHAVYSPPLYAPGEKFKGDIIYKEGRDYFFIGEGKPFVPRDK